MSKKKNKGGRPEIVFTDEQIAKVEELSAYLNCEQIADYFGISHVTFQEVRRRQEEVSFAYKKGKAHKIYNYAKKLENKAMGVEESGDTTAIIFFLKTQAGWASENKNEGNAKIPLGNRSGSEIFNGILTALEEGEISVSEAQQLTGLAIAKMNIESRNQVDKAEHEQRSMEELEEFAAKMKEARKDIEFFKENTKLSQEYNEFLKYKENNC